MIKTAADERDLYFKSTGHPGGVFSPCLRGISVPHWDMYARGAIMGLTRWIKKEHIIRVALEAIAYQNRDVLEVMHKDSGITLKKNKSGRRSGKQ